MTTTVTTPIGSITGETNKKGVIEFKGIPFAQPPIEELRFQAPIPITSLPQKFHANQFAPGCTQETLPILNAESTSEDCLYLNIWQKDISNTKKPVMVWIHGGGFATGSASLEPYNGSMLATQGDIIVVNIQYRLGMLGFGYLNGHITEDKAQSNLGLRDQITALNWIKSNIASFGGDPENVTLFGESAGAFCIVSLIASPMAQGLFNRAIVQSGGVKALSIKEAEQVTEQLFENLGIDDHNTDTLWHLPAERFVEAQLAIRCHQVNLGSESIPIKLAGFNLMPVYGDEVLPEDPLIAIQNGAGKNIDLIIGTTREEWNLFAGMPLIEGLALGTEALEDMCSGGLEQACESRLPGNGAVISATYLRHSHEFKHSKPAELYSHVETDLIFRVSSLRIAEARSAFDCNTYCYELQWDEGMLGACHASDIPFVFGDINSPLAHMLVGTNAIEITALSSAIQSCWINFATNGTAEMNCLTWPAYKLPERATLVLDKETRIERDLRPYTREIWEGIL